MLFKTQSSQHFIMKVKYSFNVQGTSTIILYLALLSTMLCGPIVYSCWSITPPHPEAYNKSINVDNGLLIMTILLD